jgi:hypothetical protein
MNKTRIMTILSVAGLFVGGAAPVLAASDTAAQNGTMTQEQIKSGECTNEGAKKQGNEEATMKRAREKSGTCDGTGTQANQALIKTATKTLRAKQTATATNTVRMKRTMTAKTASAINLAKLNNSPSH